MTAPPLNGSPANGPLRNGPIDVLRFPLEPIAPPTLASVACEPTAVAAFALPLGSLKVRTFGRVLPEGSDTRRGGALFAADPRRAPHTIPLFASSRRHAPAPTSSATRIRAPRDVVKLEDRLAYLLQPPLEAVTHFSAVTI